MDLIYTTELFSYLPEDKKQPDRFYGNEAIHGSRINYDLEFLRSFHVSSRYQKLLKDHNLTVPDLHGAFKNRYGHYPIELAESSSIPEEMANIINMRSDLEHMTFWKKANRKYTRLRERLGGKCDDVICKWLNRKKGHQYSLQTTKKNFKDLYAQYWS